MIFFWENVFPAVPRLFSAFYSWPRTAATTLLVQILLNDGRLAAPLLRWSKIV